MGAERCRQLAAEYAGLPGAAAREISEWLRGDYAFDPACLTGEAHAAPVSGDGRPGKSCPENVLAAGSGG